MSNKSRALRKEARALLEATKSSLRFFMRQAPHPLASVEDERQELMNQLRGVIDRADPPRYDTISSSIKLRMTNMTADEILRQLRVRAPNNVDDMEVLLAVEEGLQRSKQRAYIVLPINPTVLRRLAFVLTHTGTGAQYKSFQRLAKQVKAEGLSKNPMEILAEAGL